MERPGGRGVSQDRAFYRGSVVAPGVPSSSSDVSSSLSSAMSSVHIDAAGDGSALLGSGNGNGNGQSLGRGATRGRRDRAEQFILTTRPENVSSKKGAGGVEIELASNFYEMVKKPNWRLLQYRVDFKPDVDLTKARKALMYEMKERLPKFLFDGTMLFSTARLNPDDLPIILNTQRRDGSPVVITIKMVGEVMPTDYAYIQFFNIVLRQAMEKMGLSLLRRDYYDPQSATMFPNHKLEVWPGWVTSIRQHEENILLCCEVGNKVLRTDTVLDQITEILKRGGNSKPAVEKAVLGTIVITRYNNKTYRIDCIEWDKNPLTEFEKNNGEKLSLAKYYADKYGKAVRDLKQPLIISTPPLREQRAGREGGSVFLVPELCNMTGLSEEQRANFKLMTDLGKITRQGPEERARTLGKFAKRLNTNKQIEDDLKEWNLKFSTELVKVM